MKASIGHVVLRVRDVNKSKQWYQDVLGLEVTAEMPGRMVFLSSGEDSSHELALMQIGASAPGPDPHRVGLYHVGWRVPSLDQLKGLKSRLESMGVTIARHEETVTGYRGCATRVMRYHLDPRSVESARALLGITPAGAADV